MPPSSLDSWPHPILQLRRWRQERREARVELEKGTEQFERFYSHRTRIQVCPRGCGFHEQARRDLVLRTGLWGRANVVATVTFATSHCPSDGAKLVRKCARCEQPVFAPVANRCEFCGVPQPWAAERRAGAERASIRFWQRETDKADKRSNRANDPALPLYTVAGSEDRQAGDVWVLDGDIGRLAVDAVISNDDTDGQMWSQSARSIKDAAGEGVERLAQEGKPFRLGHAWLTDAGDLKKTKNIIHVASMTRYGKSNIRIVDKCLTSALALATEKEFESIGLTAFGTGPAAIDMSEWIDVFARRAAGFLGDPNRPTKLSIVLVLFDRRNFESEVENLRKAFHRAWVRLGEPEDGKPQPTWPIRSTDE